MKFLIMMALGLMTFATVANAQTKQSDYMTVLESLDFEDIHNTLLSKPTEHGLNPKSYWTDDMESQYRNGGASAPGLKEQSKASFLRLLQHLNAGAVNPETLGGDIKVKRKGFVTAPQLNVVLLANGTQAGLLADAFSPITAQYTSLKEALRRMNSFCADQWPAMPAVKKALKGNSVDPILPFIKTRLRQLGYAITTIDNVYDAQTLAAVNDIQNTLHFRPDGVISPNGKTWKYLNTSCAERVKQVRMDMEKLRWFPRDFGDRYIYVNLAMTYLTLIDKTTGTSKVMRTINGRAARKSPTLIDKIVTVVVNPFWIVPPTVFREDKLADLRGRSWWEVSEYFDSHHYQVWNKAFTRRLNPSSLNWDRMGGDADIYIRQMPGRHNALGVLKFMLTNDFAIYLHDTNQRELFAEFERQLSSGCVRVEQPYDIAEYLLAGTSWDRYKLETETAQPGEVMTKNTDVRLEKPMPVYMVFQSSTLSSDGVIRFAEDSYGQMDRISNAR